MNKASVEMALVKLPTGSFLALFIGCTSANRELVGSNLRTRSRAILAQYVYNTIYTGSLSEPFVEYQVLAILAQFVRKWRKKTKNKLR